MHLLLVSLLTLAGPVANQGLQPDSISPFLGTWTLNVAESKLGTPPQPEKLAVTFEVLGSNRLQVGFDEVYGDSRSWGHYDVGFDLPPSPGDGFPIFGPPQMPPGRPKEARFVAVRRVNDHTLLWTLHTHNLESGSEVVLTLTTTVSTDGKTMTGIGSDGSAQIFEKQ